MTTLSLRSLPQPSSPPAPKVTNFHDDLVRSQVAARQIDLETAFRATIPGYTGHRFATAAEDRRGTDVWVMREGRRDLSIDMKIRNVDPLERYGTDDLAIELFSVIDDARPGWSIDATKETDYVYWFFPGGRYVMAPFAALCMACRQHRVEWLMKYPAIEAVTRAHGNFRSQCLLVPTNVVMRALGDVSLGKQAELITLN